MEVEENSEDYGLESGRQNVRAGEIDDQEEEKVGPRRNMLLIIFYFHRGLFFPERPHAHTAAVIQSHFFVFMVGASSWRAGGEDPEACPRDF